MLLCLSVINIHQITEVHPRTMQLGPGVFRNCSAGCEGTRADCSSMQHDAAVWTPAACSLASSPSFYTDCSCAAAQQLSRLHQYLSIKTCNCAATFHIQLPGTVM